MRYIVLFMFLSLIVYGKNVQKINKLNPSMLKKASGVKVKPILKKVEKSEDKTKIKKVAKSNIKESEKKVSHNVKNEVKNHEVSKHESKHEKKHIEGGMFHKKVDFHKEEGVLLKHNELVKPERILPFVNEKYNSIILKGGQLFSKRKVSESKLNIKNKSDKNFVFDVHASKNVGCAQCHISEPSSSKSKTDYISRLNILIDKGSLDDYFKIKGHENVKDFKVKACVDCHQKDIAEHSNWLPATKNHMDKVSCETCHINKREMFTARSFNYAIVNSAGEPYLTLRGKEDKEIVGFTPDIIWYKGKIDKNTKIKPVNMVSFLVWKDGDKFVEAETLKKAFYNNGKAKAEFLKAFDGNKDNKVSLDESKLDNDAKKKVVIKLLKEAGVKEPKLTLISFPVALEHNIMPKEMATKDCASCHSAKDKSVLYKDVILSDYVATDDIDVVIPGVKDTKLAKIENGKIVLNKEKLPKEHFMMVTDTSVKEYDKYAIMLLIATILGVLGHGLLRIMFASKRNSKG